MDNIISPIGDNDLQVDLAFHDANESLEEASTMIRSYTNSRQRSMKQATNRIQDKLYLLLVLAKDSGNPEAIAQAEAAQQKLTKAMEALTDHHDSLGLEVTEALEPIYCKHYMMISKIAECNDRSFQDVKKTAEDGALKELENEEAQVIKEQKELREKLQEMERRRQRIRADMKLTRDGYADDVEVGRKRGRQTETEN